MSLSYVFFPELQKGGGEKHWQKFDFEKLAPKALANNEQQFAKKQENCEDFCKKLRVKPNN